MALTAHFTIGAACDGGRHFTASLDFTPGPTVTIPADRDLMAAAITVEERETFVRLLLKMAVMQLQGQTPAQMKAAVEAKVYDFTVGS